MTLTLNREYAARHLGVAGLFTALSGWFLHDAIFVYPNLPADGTHHTTVEFQYSFAALLGIAALVIAIRVWKNWKFRIEWDDEKIWGAPLGASPLLFTDIVGVEDGQWAKKGIIVFLAKDGRRLKLDSWHHAGARELAERILPSLRSAAEKQVG